MTSVVYLLCPHESWGFISFIRGHLGHRLVRVRSALCTRLFLDRVCLGNQLDLPAARAPHDVVLLFGVAGALGFSIGAQILRWFDLDGLTQDPLIHLPIAFVPGLAAYCAAWLTIRAWPGRGLLPRIGEGIPDIDGRRLILLAFVSAILNSAGHASVRVIYGHEQQPINDDFLMMFLGDFFGALLLLYGLKQLVVFFESHRRRTGPP